MPVVRAQAEEEANKNQSNAGGGLSPARGPGSALQRKDDYTVTIAGLSRSTLTSVTDNEYMPAFHLMGKQRACMGGKAAALSRAEQRLVGGLEKPPLGLGVAPFVLVDQCEEAGVAEVEPQDVEGLPSVDVVAERV